ncbi:MAG: FHA domain-containing protein [Chloroflexota bacterium]
MERHPYFKIESGPNQGAIIKITHDSFLIGRHSSSDYVIPNEKISRHHIRVLFKNGRWMIEDLLSKNHTRLNGVELESTTPELLSDGDRIQLATQILLKFYDPESTLNDENRILSDNLWLDTANGDVFVHNKRLDPKLSRSSFKILALLYEKRPSVVSLTEIEAAGWPGQYGVNPQMIDAEIFRLRKRLTELEPDHEFIRSERGLGKYFVQLPQK